MRKVIVKAPVMPYWITNVSNRNVTLADLAVTVRAFSTVNLMDTRHYSYTREQLEKSAASGSMFLKRTKIKIRTIAPVVHKNVVPMAEADAIPTRERSVLAIKEEHYDELQVVDQKEDEEKFAAENADSAGLDAQPQIIKRT